MSASQTENGSAKVAEAEAAKPVQHKSLAEAFAAAQSEFPAVDRDGSNPHFKSSFTTLGNLLGKVRPVLNRHGLSVIQLPARGEDGAPVLRTTIMHASGERIEADAPLLLTKQDPQGQGSAITYMRRYALAAALGISDQDDDDGNAGSAAPQATATAQTRKPSERPITGKQKGLINALSEKAGLSADEQKAILGWLGGSAVLDRITSKRASDVIDALGQDGSGAPEVLALIREQAKVGDERATKVVARYLTPKADEEPAEGESESAS